MNTFTRRLAGASILSLTWLSPLYAYEAGDIILRGGAATVDPREESSLTIGGSPVSGGLGLNSDTQLGITGTYMLTERFGIELLAATPFEHDIELNANGATVGEVKHLPPTINAQYYFMPSSSPLQVFAGAGVNYTWTLDEDLNSTGRAAGLSGLDIDNSVGLSAEIGLDYAIDERWLVNATVWYIDLSVDVSADAGNSRVEDDLDIDPFVYMVGIGYRF